MSCWERQKEEISTIKERTILLNLSDADCDRILKKAAMYGLTVAELLQNFIGDLVDGTYSNGSDERMMAQDWFDRCWFRMCEEPTLLRHLLDYDYDIEDFLVAYKEYNYSKEHPEEFAEERAELDEGEKLWFEDELQEMLEDWQHVEGSDMSKEIEGIKEYWEERRRLLG